jgi:hypothetical protein
MQRLLIVRSMPAALPEDPNQRHAVACAREGPLVASKEPGAININL